MKKKNRIFHFFALLLLSLMSWAMAISTYSLTSTDSTKLLPSPLLSQDASLVSVLYIITLASANNPTAVASAQQICPQHSIYSNGSSVQVPSMPGLATGPTGVYLWQCILVVSQSLTTPPVINYNALDSALTNPSLAFSAIAPSWQPYSAISGAQYTAYQFPNNAFVPIGIGGSGLGCGSAGGTASVTCNAGGITLNPYSSGSGQWIYYVQPSASIVCEIHRDYGSTYPCSGGGCPCDNTYTLNSGQVWVGACCSGTWNVTVTNFSDPNFNTCGGGC